MAATGTVYLVGAGPGDPGLITVRGASLLGRADVVIFDGLVGDGLLELPRPGAELLYVGKKRSERGPAHTQAEICALMVERARAGASVVRLKGGDPLIFGRIAEELEALSNAGIRFEIVPGVSSLTAAPAYAGIPITRRGVASTVAFATGHAAAGRALSDEDFEAFANADTVVLFMAVSTLRDCADRLIAGGRSGQTPAAAIYWGTTASQKTITSTLAELPDAASAAGLKPPALIVVGDVGDERYRFEWRHSRPLAGARVLVGRPRERAGAFVDEIARLGGEPLVAPLTRLEPASDEHRRTALEALEQDVDWIAFSSATGVEHFVAALLESGRDLRAIGAARLACVGESTARALARVGLRADLIPRTRSSRGLAEALLAEGVSSGQRVVVIRADGGRKDAETHLAAAGVEAVAVTLYGSVGAVGTEPMLERALSRLRGGDVDVVPFFAPSQVASFFELLESPETAFASIDLIAAIGKTTAAALDERGVDVHVIASSPDPATFAADIAAAYQARKNQG